ncbi:MAG: energy transducer TonB, partial [Pyrinomonadaceae bacterium]
MDDPFESASSEADLKYVIQKKPVPRYTETARQAGVEGKVVLLLVLDRDATVKHILVIKSLPYGLTGNCIEAARNIKFLPAMKNGLPVIRIA